ncbi:MAG: hypothetical protein JWP34_3066 [Massilia sp.]|nr:hypothetical protein [Massilia sp.]
MVVDNNHPPFSVTTWTPHWFYNELCNLNKTAGALNKPVAKEQPKWIKRNSRMLLFTALLRATAQTLSTDRPANIPAASDSDFQAKGAIEGN